MSHIQTLNCFELNKKLNQSNDDFILLDVREDNEVALCHLPKAKHIPMNLIPLYLDELPDGKEIIIYCHHGVRSLNVAHYLIENGFEPELIFNLEGGIDAWAIDIDSEMQRY